MALNLLTNKLFLAGLASFVLSDKIDSCERRNFIESQPPNVRHVLELRNKIASDASQELLDEYSDAMRKRPVYEGVTSVDNYGQSAISVAIYGAGIGLLIVGARSAQKEEDTQRSKKLYG